MKRDNRDTSPIKRLKSVLFDNWGLKLLSLALAVVIYHSLAPKGGETEKRHDGTFIGK